VKDIVWASWETMRFIKQSNKKNKDVDKITKEERFTESYNFYKNDIAENYSELYKFINFEYKIDPSKNRNHGVITVKHKICGEIFSRVAVAWKTNKNCFHCSLNRSVSLLHASMCYYGKEIYPNSEFEYDIGFKGDSGGTSKYDLFIPDYNGLPTLFEFQSRFHDYKIEFDKRKKKFAEDSGYRLIPVDPRKISPIESLYKYYGINVSNKEIQENFLFTRNYDMKKVQELLNKNLTVSEISEITNISKNIIHNTISKGFLELRKDRKEVLYGKTPVIQMTITGDFIKEFDSSWQVYKELGYNVWSCLSGICHHCHGYLFVKKDDYKSGNYTIPEKIRLFNKD
jgi:predicted DNA-binding protein YlxM (UPF0122 family)